MSNKVFIIYHDKIIIKDLLDYIYRVGTNLHICDKFISDLNYINSIQDNISNYYFLNQQEINRAYKNNALLYLIHQNYISRGITSDDFYYNNIFFLTYKEYNLIPEALLKKNNILTIWIDSSKNNKHINQYKIDITTLEKRLESVKYYYFINEPLENIYKIIENFLNNIEIKDNI